MPTRELEEDMMGWFSAIIERHPRRTVVAAIAVAIAIAMATALIVGMNTAFASHSEVSLSGSNFEIDTDANLKVQDQAPPSLDWANVSETRKADTPTGSADESFGNGTKEDTASPSVVDGGIPPNKSDLKFFGVYQEGSTSSGFLNLFWSRVQEPSGTTNMDFELNRRQCTPNLTPADPDCAPNGLTPIRSAGDILVQYDLSQGGDNPQLFVSRWLTTGDANLCEAANKVPCWSGKTNLTAAGDATGSINSSDIPAADSDGIGAQSARTFGEAQVRLSALLGTGCNSFGSAYLKSRSSDSFTSALKDFVPPASINVSNCGSVNIIKTDDASPANALNGAVFTAYNDLAPTAAGGQTAPGSEDTVTDKTCTTAGTGSTAGKCTISDLPFGSYWIVETTTPSGYTTAPPQPAVVSSTTTTVTLTFVDPRATSKISTEQSFRPQDSATVGAGDTGTYGGPNAKVKFELFQGSKPADAQACKDFTGTAKVSQEINVPSGAAGRTFTTTNSTYDIKAADAGNFFWRVTYSGDAVRTDVQSCNEVSTVSITDGGIT